MQVKIKQNDTLSSLALKYLGSVTQDDLLATVNNLEYPFIVQDPTFQKQVYASGSLSVTYTASTVPYVLPIGYLFQTVSSTREGTRSYLTTSQVTFTSTNQTITVPIQCTVAGQFGNVLAGQVTVSPNNVNLTVTNPSPITGGRIYRVLVPGDFIIIPESSTTANTTPRQSLQEQDAIGGSDFYRTPTGGLQFTIDDLLSVSGPQVIGQDIGAMISTPLNSIPENPTFGTLVPSSLGLGGEYAMQRVAVLGQGAAQSDNRVQSVGSVTMTPTGTFVSYDMTVTLNNQQNANVSVQLTQ